MLRSHFYSSLILLGAEFLYIAYKVSLSLIINNRNTSSFYDFGPILTKGTLVVVRTKIRAVESSFWDIEIA